MSKTDLIFIETIRKSIEVTRGQKVRMARDLTALYQVHIKASDQAVPHSPNRFSTDFNVPTFQRRSCRIKPVTNCDRFTEASRSAFQGIRIY